MSKMVAAVTTVVRLIAVLIGLPAAIGCYLQATDTDPTNTPTAVALGIVTALCALVFWIFSRLAEPY
jgi:hypothetical protein